MQNEKFTTFCIGEKILSFLSPPLHFMLKIPPKAGERGRKRVR